MRADGIDATVVEYLTGKRNRCDQVFVECTEGGNTRRGYDDEKKDTSNSLRLVKYLGRRYSNHNVNSMNRIIRLNNDCGPELSNVRTNAT
jgi:hypothetical protein